MNSSPNVYKVLPLDRWRAATEGLIQEAVGVDTVFFTSLVDASSLESLRLRFGRLGMSRPTYTALVVKAISQALREHPEMNRLVLNRWPFRFRPGSSPAGNTSNAKSSATSPKRWSRATPRS